MMRPRPALGLLFFCLVLTGCAAGEHLPPYHWTTTQAAIQELSARAHAVKTLSGEATVTLTRPSGDSVRLDAAIAMQPPDHLRLRAWKFNQSVFDLTFNPSGIYLVSPDDPSLRNKVHSGGVSAGPLAKMWALLSSTFFDSPNLQTSETPTQLILTAPFEKQTVTCQVDRATLTPRRYTLIDPDQRTRFTLSLDHYVDDAGIAYPHRLSAKSDDGTITIELRNIELNSTLAPNAFKPPVRAEKLR